MLLHGARDVALALVDHLRQVRGVEKVELAGEIEKEVLEAAAALDFERASFLRDKLKELKELPQLVLLDSKKKKSVHLATKKQKWFNNQNER